MAKSVLLPTVITFALVSMLSGCGQGATNSTAEVSTTQVPAAPAPVQNDAVPPADVNLDQPGDRNVTVNAPFSATRVDRDTGSVHVDAPFVHIDKAGRGQKMHIDIGGDLGGDSGSDNSR